MRSRVRQVCRSMLMCAGLMCAGLISGGATAQDLVITNVRIIDGMGGYIDHGSIEIRDGRIRALHAEPMRALRGVRVNARGLTALPGFIDGHRHIMPDEPAAWLDEQAVPRMREFLAAGFTTLMSGGGPVPGILELERRIDAGELEGPRIVTSGRVDPSNFPTPALARAEVLRLAELGVDIIKARIEPEDAPLLREIVAAARGQGLEVMVHAVTVPAMLAALDAGAGKLVHTPHDSYLTPAQARRVAAAGVENLSTVGFAVPVFGVFNQDNVPTFRDGSPWPAGILGTGPNAAGEKIVNARTLWDAGVIYGFGTDTTYAPREGLYHELKALNVMFSPQDIVRLMGPNTAEFVGLGDQIGTLTPGKRADIVLVEGNPLDLIFDLLEVRLVIKDGRIVVDAR
jgi:imidazolonepropionase-like amidohydrolase